MKKLAGVSILSGLLGGLLLGWHLGRTLTGGQVVMREMAAGAGYGKLALLQSAQADTQHAREALVSFTTFSKSMSELPSAKGDEVLLLDTGRIYLRLAALEQLAGNGGLSHQYVLNAQQCFKGTGHDIPEEKLNEEVTKINALARQNAPAS